jgi:hypothetical protein
LGLINWYHFVKFIFIICTSYYSNEFLKTKAQNKIRLKHKPQKKGIKNHNK